MIVAPHFFDDGHDGTWLEALLFSPCLNVADYVGGQLTEAGFAPEPFSHDRLSSDKGQRDHA